MTPRCAAGDGERLEGVQPPGEGRGLAEGGAAGAYEPQRPSSGPCFKRDVWPCTMFDAFQSKRRPG